MVQNYTKDIKESVYHGAVISIPIHFSGLAALMSADIARNL